MSEDPNTTDGTVENPTVEAGQGSAETFGLEYIQQLRGEAAKYRKEKKDAVAEAKEEVRKEWEAKLNEQASKTTESEAKLGAAGVELTKIKTALSLDVPSDKVIQFAAVLQGSTDDEIKTSGESAKALFGGFETNDPATDPTQGSGGTPPLNGGPLLDALKRAVGA